MKQKKEQEETITPSQYFDYLKGAKNVITTKALKDSYAIFLKLAEKYRKLGQVESIKKLCFLADTLVKEEKLIELGITTYVYKDTIEDYIENVADKAVKIVELSRYMREIPDDLVDTIEKAKPLFDELYVVFTDYTGKEERKIEKERRAKDPILFGVFKDNGNVADRFYFLGDWVDEYCDLTLDKLVEHYKDKKGVSPVVTTAIPNTSEELVEVLKAYKVEEKKAGGFVQSTDTALPVSSYVIDNRETKKKSFYLRVKSVFKK